ncbi:glutamine--fructose-6-phosphate transaminase (isomerizing), partial [candidate division KSB3 bacterium]|nr:glutamine--fructose-6-phosphate transaminase (isomerizing) [candidate division KSB3 bacterium]MBD3323075.1 glutamine--fructose-6-phosphate transaminase (isomerizing) [candidate division KSB3 bacterium]
MCGIVGIVGSSTVSDRLFRCIKNLEYRGYDSCGIAVLAGQQIEIRKNIGSVDEVNTIEHLAEAQGNLGLAHTRWATHGGVTQVNAHPHLSADSSFAVVHNGIISNYRELREELIQAGHTFRSETDTEVIPHLLEAAYRQEQDVEQAMVKTFQRLQGTYAFAFITPHAPQQIFCARKESPLVLGVGQESMFLASDINSFIDYTRDVVFLHDHEYAIIRRDTYMIKSTKTEKLIPREVQHITWSPGAAKKGGFPTFMLKEIHEQPDTVRTALSIDLAAIQKLAHMIADHRQTYLVGVGTTYYVALIAQYYFSALAGKYLPAISSDEFEYVAEVDTQTLAVYASQSGETYDTLKALRFAEHHGAKSAAIVNVVGSSLSRQVDHAIMQGSGPEICVLSTKAAIAQITILLRVALELGKLLGTLSEKRYQEHQHHLAGFPDAIQWVLDQRMGVIRR